jgi:hypothetical protein
MPHHVYFSVQWRMSNIELTTAGDIMTLRCAVQIQELNMWKEFSEPVPQDHRHYLTTEPDLPATCATTSF